MPDVPSFTTIGRYALRAITGGSKVRAIDEGVAALAADVDAKLTPHDRGTLANRLTVSPENPSTKYGATYAATDQSPVRVFMNLGTAWARLLLDQITTDDLAALAVTPAKTAPITVKAVTSATYTPVAEDRLSLLRLSNTTTQTVQLPAQATVALPVGFYFEAIQAGTGQVSFAAGTGATILSLNDRVKITGRGGQVGVVKTETNEWSLAGALSS